MTAASRPRFAVVDIARGVAIIAMVIYHLCWDLSYFRFIAADVGYDPAWVLFARTILGVFLFLVGVGLVLGHGKGIRWKAFWRRWLFVFAGALAITAATYFAIPDAFVYFGVLHAIALFSILGLSFVRTPVWVAVIVTMPVIALPFFFTAEVFNLKQWSWLGFWQVPPLTNDLVPVFPWFGAVLVGIIAARLVLASRWVALLSAITARGKVSGLLALMGRWSLLIYLLHQPILLAVLNPAAALLQPQLAMREPDFLRSCQSTCEAGGTSPGQCTTYCQCGLEGVNQNDLWNAILTGQVTASEQALLDAQNRQCSALIYPELNGSP